LNGVSNWTSATDNGNVWNIYNFRDRTRDQSFNYDMLNRLTSAQNAGTNCAASTVNGKTEYWGNNYGYDAWGNLTAKSVTKCSAENMSLTALLNNQLSGYGYDAAGNMTSDPTDGVTSSYDAENRIASATKAGVITSYVYDADGNRVKKSSGVTGTLYWYMTPGIIGESDLSGVMKSEYVFFNGDRVARRDLVSPGGVSYYFSDHLKTASVVTDSAGNIKAESDYYPWGGELQFVNNDSNHYKFTGKERDSESGLDYFGARYNSSGIGRFTTPDPLLWIQWQRGTQDDQKKFEDYIANPQHFNMYTYVLNNPLRYADPTGMNACGGKDDSSCKVTVTFTDRSKDKNGQYNDQFSKLKGNGSYNAVATVSVNGKVVGTYLADTVSSGNGKFATLQNGTYEGVLHFHHGDPDKPSIELLSGGKNHIPTTGPNPAQRGASFATDVLIHSAEGQGVIHLGIRDFCLTVTVFLRHASLSVLFNTNNFWEPQESETQMEAHHSSTFPLSWIRVKINEKRDLNDCTVCSDLPRELASEVGGGSCCRIRNQRGCPHCDCYRAQPERHQNKLEHRELCDLAECRRGRVHACP
jgi:RHS repeat-associated protein